LFPEIPWRWALGYPENTCTSLLAEELIAVAVFTEITAATGSLDNADAVMAEIGRFWKVSIVFQSDSLQTDLIRYLARTILSDLKRLKTYGYKLFYLPDTQFRGHLRRLIERDVCKDLLCQLGPVLTIQKQLLRLEVPSEAPKPHTLLESIIQGVQNVFPPMWERRVRDSNEIVWQERSLEKIESGDIDITDECDASSAQESCVLYLLLPHDGLLYRSDVFRQMAGDELMERLHQAVKQFAPLFPLEA
jgi:hypothetical protein